MTYGNIDADPSDKITVEVGVEMQAFDRLPERLRDALNYSQQKYSATEFENLLQTYMAERLIIGIKQQDTEYDYVRDNS